MTTLQLGINRGISNTDYHADRTYLSSSKLKVLAEDPAEFYQQHILGNYRPMSGAFLDVGSLTHSLLLEPDLVAEEYAIYTGKRRAGAEFDAYRLLHPGKKIMLASQDVAARSYASAAHYRPELMALLTGGEAELSIAAMLQGVAVKMRADYINPTAGYILDIKTTSDSPGADNFRDTVGDFSYDFSAALYCLIAEQHYGKPFTFYWGVISKQYPPVADVYVMSTATRLAADKAVSVALANYIHCSATGIWQLPDTGTEPASTDYVIEQI